MRHHVYRPIVVAGLLALSQLMVSVETARAQQGGDLRFEVSFPSSANTGPLTGRAFVIISERGDREPRLQTGSDLANGTPIWATNFSKVSAGDPIAIDGDTFGFPYESLRDLPPGEYYVQAVVSIYTRFDRADGHSIWIHNDQWEGQKSNTSPGNLYSDVIRMDLDPADTGTVSLSVKNIIPPIDVPTDTEWVRHIKFQSDLLTEFWGQPIYLGATILLPMGYDSHTDTHYPVNYIQGHFSSGNPHGFNPDPPVENEGRGRRGYDFYRYWVSDEAPRMLAVTFQHPTPYYDDSYAVNSENVGPYGDAIMQELIVAVEEQFRVIREPWARVLSGGSTGGWESLALQIFNPDFFGGTWSLCPDPVDFRYYELINIYEDENAFFRTYRGLRAERPEARDTDGQIRYTVRQTSHYERVLGENHRSGAQWAAWEASYSPVGEDGFPRPLWNWYSGEIDSVTAETWRKYDLREYLEQNWSWIGEKLEGKLHIYTGDMDTYYLNNATVLLEEFLESTTDPYYDGVVEYGDRQPHCWGPRGGEAYSLYRDHIIEHAPEGADVSAWNY